MLDTATVSVILRTYNRSQVVGRAILSVQAQTFPNWELLVVDDGSRDNTEEVVQGFQDPRIRYLRHQVNRGAPVACNTGIMAALGEYLTFLDSDDELSEFHLARLLDRFSNSPRPDVGLVSCGISYVTNGTEAAYIPRFKGPVFEDILSWRENGGIMASSLIKRSYLVDSGILVDEELPTSHDRDFLLRLSQVCGFDCVPEILYKRHLGGADRISRLSGVTNKKIIGQEKFIDKYAKELELRPRVAWLHHIKAASMYRKIRVTAKVRSHLMKAIRAYPMHPGNIKYLSWIVASLFGPTFFGSYYRVYGALAKAKRNSLSSVRLNLSSMLHKNR